MWTPKQEQIEVTSVREERFVQGIMEGLLPKEAYVAAGYPVKGPGSATVGANNLLAKESVQILLSQMRHKVMEEVHINAVDVAKEIAAVAFSDIRDYVSLERVKLDTVTEDGVPEDTTVLKIKELNAMKNTRAISGIKQGRYGIEIKLWDKVKALELLGKYFDMFGDNAHKVEPEMIDYNNLSTEELTTMFQLTQKARQSA